MAQKKVTPQSKPYYEDFLVCPVCKHSLEHIEDGYRCHEHGVFHIKHGFVCFAPQQSKEFDRHWQDRQAEIPVSKIAVAEAFLKPLHDNIKNKDHIPLSILDVGCGDGVHVSALQKSGFMQRIYYLGIDVSINALESSKRKAVQSCEFIQCDAVMTPLNDDTFDSSFSYGVLAYTSDPLSAFKEMVRVTKRGGVVGIWLYPRPEGVTGFLLRFVRKLIKLGGPAFATLLVNSLVPVLGFLPTASKVSLRNATWRQCREVIEVNLLPSNIQYYKTEEIVKWYADSGVEVTYMDADRPISIWGIRK